jgi:hypothetical protein
MSEFRFEKRRINAHLALSTGTTVSGCFFVAGGTATHTGPERVGDLLNAQPGFFPFELIGGNTALYNRAHIVMVALAPGVSEAELDPGYEVAKRRTVAMLLSTGRRVAGTVAVYQPAGRDRLSDYARSGDMFRYLVTPEQTLIINAAHIVEIVESAS